ncbi:MAG: ethanolamine ammonia-lyase reactivating factor EutA [Planctomycetes bacterium]|nr:ethanolamine ammonia-lyase reactivating factor EutA [Planctomycetota bacterium]
MAVSFDNSLRFVGIDVGSTTTSLLVVRGRLLRNCVTGRNEWGDIEPVFRPEPVFTPFVDQRLDLPEIARQIDAWLAAAALEPAAVAAGGALVTGLAARADNARGIKEIIRGRFQQAVVATADDPCFESWLAFMGNCLSLSRAHPERPVINLDIGGGTTNLAWGQAGAVRRCGCYFIGARHVQVVPGTYVVRHLSEFGHALFQRLQIPTQAGYELNPADLQRVLQQQVDSLTHIVRGEPWSDRELWSRLCQAEFHRPEDAGQAEPIITLSGGVGELAYRLVQGRALPTTTAFGDLGIDLARAIVDSPELGRDLARYVPAGLGRATVQGLTLHSTEIAGSTLFLPHPELLPQVDLPILGTLYETISDTDLHSLLELAGKGSAGAALRVQLGPITAASVKHFGERLAQGLQSLPWSHPLVLLTAGNIGKTLGQYATRWGRLQVPLIVVDEVPDRPAQFATVGELRNGLVPVAFHGLGTSWESD